MGQRVVLKPFLQYAISNTTLHPATEPLLLPRVLRTLPGLIEVTQETTLEAGQRLHNELGAEVATSALCILNFASARNPGGGFQNGSQAQEESLARSSGLFACLEAHHDDFYMPHRKDPQDGLYSHAMLHSPNVPFFREDRGSFCPLWCASVITSPAPNAGLAAPKQGQAVVDNIMEERCYHILRLARDRGHTDLVLGAFGCGVFGNDPKHVAACFCNLLCDSGEFAGHFRRIVFAIPGHQDNTNSRHSGHNYLQLRLHMRRLAQHVTEKMPMSRWAHVMRTLPPRSVMTTKRPQAKMKVIRSTSIRAATSAACPHQLMKVILVPRKPRRIRSYPWLGARWRM